MRHLGGLQLSGDADISFFILILTSKNNVSIMGPYYMGYHYALLIIIRID